MSNVKDFYEESYKKDGLDAQRRYPNEELCRFIGRNFPRSPKRKNIRILEVGCGSCSNVWMLSREGFDVYGCDLSEHSIVIGQEVLKIWKVDASLSACDMIDTPYADCFFDAVVDVFSSNCLCRDNYIAFLKEMHRIIKSEGKFFSYFPSKQSDTYRRSTESERIDIDTLHGVKDEKSPYCGNDYPFRFMSNSDVQELLPNAGFALPYLEKTGRTYQKGEEYFEWLVFEAYRQ